MRTLQVERGLAVRVFFARGAFEGVFAAGGEVDGAVAQVHRMFDGHDLQAGDGGEAGSSCRPARRPRSSWVWSGSVRVRNTPIPAFSRSMTPLQVADHADADVLARLDRHDGAAWSCRSNAARRGRGPRPSSTGCRAGRR